ncbi:hypothetical protein FLONG3_3567 [Fusarium longipes]|uniref:Apple domain-containing protein n=1 Tax=Fusarium longipes TaxID=694270 RepID=A0A395T1Q5_9HYPO|nr:hypothetical protein FLONG3_3567 [Fusarium longipes]
MRFALIHSLLLAVVSVHAIADTVTHDATSPATCTPDACNKAVVELSGCRHNRMQAVHQNDCSSFLRYTSIPAPMTLTETFGEQSTLTLVDVETLDPKTDEATTQLDETATTVLTLEPETFTVSITPTSIVTVTVTPDPYRSTKIDTKTVLITETTTTVKTVYYSNLAKRDIVEETGTIIKPTDIPSYASACADSEQYSSACACLGVQVTTIEGTGSPVIKTVDPKAATGVYVETATRPAVTVTTTLPAKTQTVTVTLPALQVTESTTFEPTTVEVSTTANQDTVITTQEVTRVDTTTSVIRETRSVGPVCSTYTSSNHCDCKYEIICGQGVDASANTFFSRIEFLKYKSSIEECMDRCDSDPRCQFGDFVRVNSGGGLCSIYALNPGSAGRSVGEGYTYFEKNGDFVCAGCS